MKQDGINLTLRTTNISEIKSKNNSDTNLQLIGRKSKI